MARGDLPFSPRRSGVGIGADLGLDLPISARALLGTPYEGHPDEWADHPSGLADWKGGWPFQPACTLVRPCGPFRTGLWQECGFYHLGVVGQGAVPPWSGQLKVGLERCDSLHPGAAHLAIKGYIQWAIQLARQWPSLASSLHVSIAPWLNRGIAATRASKGGRQATRQSYWFPLPGPRPFLPPTAGRKGLVNAHR